MMKSKLGGCQKLFAIVIILCFTTPVIAARDVAGSSALIRPGEELKTTNIAFESAFIDQPSELNVRADISNNEVAQYQKAEAVRIFEENRGQTDARVKFISRYNDDTLFLLTDGMVVVSNKLAIQPGDLEMMGDGLPATVTPTVPKSYSVERVAFSVQFITGNPEHEVKGLNSLPSKSNYFLSTDSEKSYTQIPHYAMVQYRDIYPGIDLEVAGPQGDLSQKLTVQDGVNLESARSVLQNLRLRVDGVDNVTLEDDHLRITTSLGDYILPLLTVDGLAVDAQPSIIQIAEGIFEISAPYAPVSVSGRDVASDPGQSLVYSTYLGGTGNDKAWDIAVDGAGNVYVTGATTSLDFPTTQGAYDASYNGDPFDAFVTKLSADGKTLLYSTYFGGTNEDWAEGIAVDSSSSVYIAGKTYSPDFPITPGALDRTLNGGRDGFVAKLNATGDGLVYSTYLGGDSWDYCFCLAIDEVGSAYVGGFTHGDFPITPGAAQPDFGGLGDGFAVKLSPDGSRMLYSTYLGGPDYESIPGIAVDDAGNAYLGGRGVAKLNADGSAFIYHNEFVYQTLLASASLSEIAVDEAGNVYGVGWTTTSDFPVTPDAVQPTFGGGSRDAVIAKLNENGSALLYSTFLGGNGTDWGLDLSLDDDGNAYVMGRTSSLDFPTVDPLQTTNHGGYDLFLAKVNAPGTGLLFSSYLGGSRDEYSIEADAGIGGLAIDSTGNVYVTGSTTSTDFPTTSDAYDPSYNGGDYDTFVAKLMMPAIPPLSPTPPPPIYRKGGGGGASRDSDGDGYPDIEELIAGTNPHDPEDYPYKLVVTPTPTLTPEPTASATPEPTPAITGAPTELPITPTPLLVDTDGDGVPDEYDYAPKDPEVQSKSDIKTPAFEAIFAMIGLLTVAYLLVNDRSKR
jgi:hypothetical protein